MDHSHHHHQNTEAAPVKKQTAAISHSHHDMNPPWATKVMIITP
jgi:hypothetical protein